MQLLTINKADNQYLHFISQLFHQAFPPSERREWLQLVELINGSTTMYLKVVTVESKAVGFVIYWDLDDWRFIEYLAIAPDFRGMKYGEQVMEAMIKDRNLLLEVEAPSSVDAKRRIKFYEKLGLAVLPYHYRQPSYTEVGVYYDMKLMSNRPDLTILELDVVLKNLLLKIYGTSGISLEYD